MKKLILSLLIFFSVISQAQIQIPQVVGLPSALNSKVDKVTGKSLVADTSIVKLTGIQAGAQVNKLEGIQKNGVDLPITGKKVNITVPTTASDISAEPANTNIQSHISSTSNPHSVTKSQVGLGNVDNTSDINKPISTATQTALDGKQLIGTYATGTGTANGTNTGDETLTSIKTKLGAATSVSDGYLKYQDWSMFNSKEPAITKKSGFNLPIGTTTGTVLEGRTFGTAANSTVDNNGGVGPIWGGIIPVIGSDGVTDIGKYLDFHNTSNDGIDYANRLTSNGSSSMLINGYSIYHTGNLTSSLTTNSISRWNGTNFANSLISDDGTYLKMRNNLLAYTDGGSVQLFSGTNSLLFRNNLDTYTIFSISNAGDVSIPISTTSTSPTTGALVVGGGVGANHVRANNFYGNGSNLTGVQLPITLTTNGTSGVATFSGNVLNVPNYDVSGGVNQTQTTVNGSISGHLICSMPIRTSTYKKVIIDINGMSGTATYTFPVAFTKQPEITSEAAAGANQGLSTTGMTVDGLSYSRLIIIEGY